MIKFYSLICLLSFGSFLNAQTVLVSEDFENSLTSFTQTGGSFYSGLSGSGDRPALSSFASGNAGALGVSSGTLTLTSGPLVTTGFPNSQLQFRLASFSIGSTSNGADAGDLVRVDISADGGQTYSPTLQVAGNANAWWGYASGTGLASASYDGDNTPILFSPIGGGGRTSDGYSTVKISGLPAVADLRIRIVVINNSVNERWVIDELSVSTPAGPSPATALRIAAVNPQSPNANAMFSLDIETVDASQQPAPVQSATSVQLSVSTGNGILAGTLSATIAAGSSSLTLPGISYSLPETGVILTVTAVPGSNLTAANSSPIQFRSAATKLAFAGWPPTAIVNTTSTAFAIESRRPDGSIDSSFNGLVSLSKIAGPGLITGTVSTSVINGTAAFGGLQFSSAGTYQVQASTTGLDSDTATINVTILQPFSSGNLVVYRVGDGSASLSSAAAPVFLDEWTPAGVLQRSLALPVTAQNSNKRLTASGSSQNEGLLTRSVDKQYLLLTGYEAAVGTASVATTTASSINRIIARVDVQATINTSTSLAIASGNSIRSAASIDGTNLWIGTGAGIYYSSLGNTTATLLTSTNTRSVGIFDGQLYGSTASGTSFRLFSVGTGIPLSTAQTLAALPGFPLSGNPNAFYFADLDGSVPGIDVLYCADESATGLQKFSLVANSWVANGSIPVGGNALRGLTGMVNGNAVTLFGTNPGSIFRFTDPSGYNGNFTATPQLVATAAANTVFRGIAMAPEALAAGPLPVRFSFVSARELHGGTIIEWTNVTEENIERYDIERSTDGIHFNRIGKVLPKANNNHSASYSFVDGEFIVSDRYYRIKALENDGSQHYSSIVRIRPVMSGDHFSVSPNPVTGGKLQLLLQKLPVGPYRITILNTAHQVVIRETLMYGGGTLSALVQVYDLKPGIYLVRLSGGVQLSKWIVIL